jgi:hypothetical protein
MRCLAFTAILLLAANSVLAGDVAEEDIAAGDIIVIEPIKEPELAGAGAFAYLGPLILVAALAGAGGSSSSTTSN